MNRVLGVLTAAVAVSISTPALAGTIVLTNGGSNSQVSKTFSNSQVQVKATAFSINSSNVIKTAQLASWSDGLGVYSPGSDNSHTVDNSSWTDFVLFQFNKTVTLNTATFTTGWHNMNDTDATIGKMTVNWASFSLPWNTDLTGFLNNQNKSYLTANFGLQASNSIGNGGQTRNVNPSLATGNVWLISSALVNPDTFKDGFKIKQFTYAIPTPTGGVPEPSTWAMLILGMGAVGGAMRRRTRAKLALA